MEKMHFTRMGLGSDEDFRILKRVHENTLKQLPEWLLSMLRDLSGDQAYNLNRLEHSLQSATRALRDDADEELIVVALFHDVGEALGPMNHGEIAAAILHPFISDDNYNLLKFHGLFQTYFFGPHLGLDQNARDKYNGRPWYQKIVVFCAQYDEVSFDPAYQNEPLSTFEPMVRRLLDRPWLRPHPSKSEQVYGPKCKFLWEKPAISGDIGPMPGSFKERNLGLLRVKRLRLLETWVMWEKINVPENRRLRSADFTPEQGPLQWRLRY